MALRLHVGLIWVFTETSTVAKARKLGAGAEAQLIEKLAWHAQGQGFYPRLHKWGVWCMLVILELRTQSQGDQKFMVILSQSEASLSCT